MHSTVFVQVTSKITFLVHLYKLGWHVEFCIPWLVLIQHGFESCIVVLLSIVITLVLRERLHATVGKAQGRVGIRIEDKAYLRVTHSFYIFAESFLVSILQLLVFTAIILIYQYLTYTSQWVIVKCLLAWILEESVQILLSGEDTASENIGRILAEISIILRLDTVQLFRDIGRLVRIEL